MEGPWRLLCISVDSFQAAWLFHLFIDKFGGQKISYQDLRVQILHNALDIPNVVGPLCAVMPALVLQACDFNFEVADLNNHQHLLMQVPVHHCNNCRLLAINNFD